MIIRKEQIESMPAVLELIKEMTISQSESASVEIEVTEMEHDGFGNGHKHCTLSVKIGGKTIGMALLFSHDSTWKEHNAHLEDIKADESIYHKDMVPDLYAEIKIL